ncbi:lipocalin-like domain-containing protein [Falsiroseomonas sp. E2-1-a20]|uniref:lipocalin-like domain-containing protein n=1 Tax=Falsiroseomonas sp. E2-1-a20 TaxID=3239300 RepID=UPI003F328D7D
MPDLIGTWKLLEARAYDVDGTDLPPPLGPEPMGVILYGPERIMVTLGDGRRDAPAPRAFNAYAGRYDFDGETLVIHVDSASSPESMTKQVRRLIFETPDRYVAVPLTPFFGIGSGLKHTWQRTGR